METAGEFSGTRPEFGVLLERLRLIQVEVAGLRPVVQGCSAVEAREGLGAVEVAVRSLQALAVGFVQSLGSGRDSVAAVKRATGMSGSSARGLAAAAKVAAETPAVEELLTCGEISVDHVQSLGQLAPETVAELLPLAAKESADQFRRTVAEYRVLTEADSLAEEQRLSRKVSFFTQRNGCVGATIVLPPIAGAEFRNTLNELCDQAWRKEHPERAETEGGHDGEPRERRLADALISWMASKTLQLGKPVVVVTCDLDTMTAVLLPDQPISFQQAAEMTTKAECYAAIRDGTNTANLRFGRNRRFATFLQRLALQVMHPTCQYPGCSTSADRCDAHHVVEFDDGGLTNIENLANLCGAHHRHLHLSKERLAPDGRGGWRVEQGDRSQTDRSQTDRSQTDRSQTDRSQTDQVAA